MDDELTDEEKRELLEEEELTAKNEIETLIDDEELEASGGELACPNCESLCEIYCHKYDEELCAITCPNCRYDEWITTGGASPYRCQVCDEFVTDEQMEKVIGLKCSAVDAEGISTCEQRIHENCADYCSDCGYLCEDEIGNYLECNSCGKLHDPSHFVSHGSDFIDEFGLICESCFYEDEDEYHLELPHWKIGTPSEEEEEAEKKNVEKAIEAKKIEAKEKAKNEEVVIEADESESVIINMLQTSSRNRSDQSTYLSHFIRKRKDWSEDDCLRVLLKILMDKKLIASPTGYYSTYSTLPAKTAVSKAVCLTEGRLTALSEHIEEYSAFGLGLSKFFLMNKFECAPCIYMNDSIIDQVRATIPDKLVPFVNTINRKKGRDYHHEREWRTPKDIDFSHSEINFIFAPRKFHSKIYEVLDTDRPIYCIETISNL